MAPDDEIGVRIRIRERREFSQDAKRAKRDIQDLGDESKRTGDKIDIASASTKAFQRTIANVKPAAIIAGIGVAAQGISAAGAGIVALGAGLAPVTGALAAYPALGSAAAQGLGTFRFATLGVTDALGGLNEGMDPEKLSALTGPAQQFVKQLDAMKGPIISVQRRVAAGLFPGVVEGLRTASPALAVFRRQLPQTAQVLGQVATQAGAFVNALVRSGDLETQLQRNNRWLAAFGQIGINVANVVRHITLAAGPLVNWLVRSAAAFSENVSEMTFAARQSGQLARFFDQTRVAISRVVRIAADVAVALFNIAKAGKPLGDDLLVSLVRNADAFREWTESARGQNSIARFFRNARAPIYEVSKLVLDVVKAFGALSQQPGLARMIAQIRTDLLPVLVRVLNSTTAAFGPAMVEAIIAIARAFEPLAGAGGPLILYVNALTALARAATFITTNVPGAATALTFLFGTIAVGKILQVNALVTAIRAAAAAANMSALAWLRWRAQIIAVRAAMIVATATTYAMAAATRVARGAVLLMNLALLANPAVLVVAALAAIGVGLVLLYRKVSWFRNGVNAAWNWLKTATSNVAGFITSRFQTLVRFLTGLPGRVRGALSSMWDGLKSGFRSAINWVIGAWNGLEFRIGGGDVFGVDLPSVTIGTPDIPTLATGGLVSGLGSWITGERGPELNTTLPGGRVRVQPLNAAPAGAAAGPGGGVLRVEIPVMMNRREIGRATREFTLDELARA